MTAHRDRFFSVHLAKRPPVLIPVLGALAYAGCVVAYLPLLTLLLPLRVEALAGNARFGVLAITLIAGAVMASIAGILFGWLSDCALERGIDRRYWIAAGLLATIASYVGIAGAWTPAMIVVAVMAFQVALNAVLAPLMALLAEESPDRQKGLMSGLLAAAQPLGAAIGALLVKESAWTLGVRLAVIAGIVVLCLGPLLATSGRVALETEDRAVAPSSPDLVIAWISRLIVQISGNVVPVYLLFFMEQFTSPSEHGAVSARVGALIFLANSLPLPFAILLGRWSDRLARRKPFMMAAVLLDAGGLVMMACATDWIAAAIGLCLYSIGWTVFLNLQIGFVMQLLPNPRRRGRDLGLINVSNTAPVLIGPALAWWLATPQHFAPLLVTLAILSLFGGAAMLGVRGRE